MERKRLPELLLFHNGRDFQYDALTEVKDMVVGFLFYYPVEISRILYYSRET